MGHPELGYRFSEGGDFVLVTAMSLAPAIVSGIQYILVEYMNSACDLMLFHVHISPVQVLLQIPFINLGSTCPQV